MHETLTMTKLGMKKLLRRYSFLVVVVTAVFLGVVCVPSASAGYEIFNLGGVRGLYNSAWLGTLGAMLCCILLWLPGFYLLRSQITEDAQLKMEQIIAATPISKLKYLFLKAGANLLVFIILQGLFLVSFAVMQLIRGEDLSISILSYLLPFVFISLPALCVAAALTVLFDVVPFLRGAFGNILIFIIWVTGSSVSVAMPGNSYDLFGIGFMLKQMLLSAKQNYPGISVNSGSFGYYPIEKISPVFSFEGVVYNSSFLLARPMWIGLSVLLLILAAVIVGRFRNKKVVLPSKGEIKEKQCTQQVGSFSYNKAINLPAIERTLKAAFLQMVFHEMKILLPHSVWWYITALVGFISCIVLPISLFMKWSCIVLLLPMGVWSKMGCHEKLNRTDHLSISSCASGLKWWLTFTAGTAISFILSIPILTRFIILSLYFNAVFWIIGVLFVSSLAMILGRISGTPRFFEAVYIMFFYLGGINGLKAFDFLGLTGNNIFYLLASVLLIILSLGLEAGKRGTLR